MIIEIINKIITKLIKRKPIMMSEYGMIKKSVLDLGYKWFEGGDYDLNIIWVRMNDNVNNKMDDYCLTCYTVQGVEYVTQVRANTLPGTYGGLYNPVTVRGITGTAVVQPQQVLGAYHYNEIGFPKNDYNPFHSSYFSPTKSIKIWRDNNRDDEIDYMQPEDSPPSDVICWHFQGEPISSPGHNPWSIGCLGTMLSDWRDIVIPIIRKAIAIWGTNFTLTLIENKDLIIPITK